MSTPERVLWSKIRNEQLGVKFRRQYAIENRIFDFYAPEIKLAIEIDGESHFIKETTRENELKKDQYFYKKYGINILRFLNPEIRFNTDEVLNEIQKFININPPS